MKAKQKQYIQHQIRLKNKSLKRPLGRPQFLTERDCRILKYLWRWKIASTASVHEMINRPNSEYSTYKILFKLESSGFITTLYDYVGPFSVWALTNKGFLVLKNTLPKLSDESFMSEDLNHDRFVQAFHLGEWSTHQLPAVHFFTRQEIQRIDHMDFPDWVPKSKEHAPDGITQIQSFKKNYVLAFEVELNLKRNSTYEAMLQYYKHAKNISRVYWLVSEPQIKEQILKAKAAIHDESFNYHVFVDLEDFKKTGWDAVIFNERSVGVHTIRENMQEICGDIYSEIIGQSKGQSKVSVHLNHLKVIGKSKP